MKCFGSCQIRIAFFLLVLFFPTNAIGQEVKQTVDKRVTGFTSLDPLFNDNFKLDSRPNYESTGKVTWESGKLILPPASTLKRTFNNGSWVRVDLEFAPLNFNQRQPESQLEIHFELENSKSCVVRISQTLTDSKVSS